ncbi:hypothetical protein [uncultured Dysosmobacter sp.]|uniref:hypothetical protein n=1 Tax=uncultured Dysosmobacter sp. TaxID=2591384 RepID=UPI00262DF416|nr:hypothetical protein [uncultured Dysosmobacter sp.]
MQEYLPRILGFTCLCIGIWALKKSTPWKLLLTAGLLATAIWSLFWTATAKLLLAFPVAALLAVEVWWLPRTYNQIT